VSRDGWNIVAVGDGGKQPKEICESKMGDETGFIARQPVLQWAE
jgi:hypothetical protein